jgi:hypothetical protein
MDVNIGEEMTRGGVVAVGCAVGGTCADRLHALRIRHIPVMKTIFFTVVSFIKGARLFSKAGPAIP